MGSRLTVLCGAHVEAITADVSGMQISSKWVAICRSLDLSPPHLMFSISAPLTRYAFVSLCLRLGAFSFLFPNPFTYSLHLSLSMSPGMRREAFGLLSGGSKVSLLL